MDDQGQPDDEPYLHTYGAVSEHAWSSHFPYWQPCTVLPHHTTENIRTHELDDELGRFGNQLE